DVRAVALDMVVLRVRLGDQAHRIIHARAAALLDAEPDAPCIVAPGDDLADAIGGLVGEANDGKASHVLLHCRRVQGPRNAFFSPKMVKDCNRYNPLQATRRPMTGRQARRHNDLASLRYSSGSALATLEVFMQIDTARTVEIRSSPARLVLLGAGGLAAGV